MMTERAGLVFGSDERELRHRCRSAPEFVRVAIDKRRALRGLPPLWPGARRSDAARSTSRAVRRVRFFKAFLAAYGHRD